MDNDCSRSKKGLVVINAYANYPNLKKQVERYVSCFERLGVQLDCRKNDVLCYLTPDGKVEKTFDDVYDFVLYLDKDKHVAMMLTQLGYRLFNSAQAIEACDDKMLTHLLLANMGIKMPLTVSAPLCYTPNGENDDVLENVASLVGFPMVIKENFGSFGEQVFLADNRDEMETLHKKLLLKPHVFQQFVVPSYGVDARLIVVGGKVCAAMKRVAHGDFRANIQLGGEGQAFDAPQSFVDVAEKAAKALKLDYCGVDVLFGENDEPILCEVNSNAYFDGIIAVTKIDVADIYTHYIYKEIYHEI